MTQQLHFWEFIWRNQNTNSKEHKYPCVSLQNYLLPPRYRSSPISISRWVDKTTIGHLYNRILLSCKKEDFILYDSMDSPGEHYAKWNKPVRERHIPYGFTHMKFNEQTERTSKTETDLQIENRLTVLREEVVVRGWRDWAQKKKDSWIWTTVWWLWAGRVIRGINGNRKMYNKNAF